MGKDRKPDWEERRFQIAKDIFAACIASENQGRYRADVLAESAVRQADMLIKFLKEKRKNINFENQILFFRFELKK